MTFAVSQWILMICIFLLGAGAGVLFYRFTNASVAQQLRISQELTERELELNQLKEGLNDHFIRTADQLSELGKQLKGMESQLRLDAEQLSMDEALVKRLADQTAVLNPDTPTETLITEPPKDYDPEQLRGTLSEDFGLTPGTPPRY